MAITNLTDYLKSIADSIRTKKGTTTPINAQNFASEIESIEGGGSGGATLKGGLLSTAVPVDETTYIENLYLNKELSNEEVVNLLEINISLSPLYTAEQPMGFICLPENGVIALAVMAQGGIAMIANTLNGDFYFAYDGTGAGEDIAATGFSGWNPNFDGVIAINDTQSQLSSTHLSAALNENLKSLFSITPFANKEPVTLSGEYTPKNVNKVLNITENGTTTLSYASDFETNKEILTEVDVKVNVNTPTTIYVNTGETISGLIKGNRYIATGLTNTNRNGIINTNKLFTELQTDEEHEEYRAIIDELIIENEFRYNERVNNNDTFTTIAPYSYSGLGITTKGFKSESITNLQSRSFDGASFYKITLPNLSSVYASSFWYCQVYTLILGQPTCSIVNYSNSSLFLYYETPYIYVPDDAVENYKSATGWSHDADKILPVSQIENGWHLKLYVGKWNIGSGIKYKVNNGEYVEITSTQTIELTNVKQITFAPIVETEIFSLASSGVSLPATLYLVPQEKTISLNHDFILYVDKFTTTGNLTKL